MVVNPITLGPEATLADALDLMAAHGISGIPVVEGEARRLVGILTNRDVRFATDLERAGARADDRGSRWSRCARAWGATRPSSSCTSTASRSCWWSTTTTA